MEKLYSKEDVKFAENVVLLNVVNMYAYKLVRQMKDGSLASLFINKKARLPLNKWIQAEDFPTKGYKHRPGWHCTIKPKAPHLSKKGRVWVKVKVLDYEYEVRPESQGGLWILADNMKILRIL